MTLIIENLTKDYGEICALNDVSFTFKKGIYALLGPNGAGKTTLLNLLTQNILPKSGIILCDGQLINKPSKLYRSRLGYMPQQQQLPHGFTAERFLFYIAALKGMSKENASTQINELLDVCNLTEHRKKNLGALSGGMKQRVLLAQTLLNKPELIILDEPTAGLDPKERINIRNIVSKAGIDCTVIFATHVVSDIEHIAQEVLFLRHGELVLHGSVEELLHTMEGRVWEMVEPVESADEMIASHNVCSLFRDEKGIHLRVVSDTQPHNATSISPILEDLYLWLYGGDI